MIGFFLTRQDNVGVGTISEDRFAELALSRDEVEIRVPKTFMAHEEFEDLIKARHNRRDIHVAS